MRRQYVTRYYCNQISLFIVYICIYILHCTHLHFIPIFICSKKQITIYNTHLVAEKFFLCILFRIYRTSFINLACSNGDAMPYQSIYRAKQPANNPLYTTYIYSLVVYTNLIVTWKQSVSNFEFARMERDMMRAAAACSAENLLYYIISTSQTCGLYFILLRAETFINSR